MPMKRLPLFFLILLFLSSCGYKIVREKGINRGEIRSIYVSAFKNSTFEPHISMYVTDAIVSELISLGLFEINRPNYEATLEGVISKIKVRPQSLDKKGFAVEKKVEVEVDIFLKRASGQLIKKWSLVENETFRSDNPNYEDYNKREAIKRAAEKIARRLCSLLFMEH